MATRTHEELVNLHQPIDYAIPLYSDSQSAIYLAENLTFHARNKHVEVQYHFVHEKLLLGDINMQFVNTNNQVVDIFTKGFSSTKFTEFQKQLGITSRSNSRESRC